MTETTTTDTPSYRSPAADLRLAASGVRQDAKLAAAMGQDFAEALADWLEDVAREAAEMLKLDTPECVHDGGDCYCRPVVPVWGCDRCGEYLAPGACTCWEKPLAVARAYLDGAK
jgi:hypothetical protein